MNSKSVSTSIVTKYVNGVKTTVTTITTKEGNKTTTQVITSCGEESNHDELDSSFKRDENHEGYDEDSNGQDLEDNENTKKTHTPSGDEFIDGSLKKHNYFRALHGVTHLTHNPELSKLAQSYAEKLASNDSFQHSNCKWGSKQVGENLAMCGGYDMTPEASSQMWYDEISDYSFEKSEFTSGTGHFTQLVWKSTKEVGFGLAQSKWGNWYSVANYYPPGNYLGQFKQNVFPPK